MPRTGERGGPKTRARILEVSTRLFLERGFELVTVAEIAREAGVSSVTVFNHFPRKEDLFLDRSADAVELLHSAVWDRPPGTDVLASLRETTLRLLDGRHPLSGIDDRSMPFFATVAASPTLIARTREIAADLQQSLAGELRDDPTFAGDPTLLAAFFITGFATVLVETARRRTAQPPVEMSEMVHDHRVRLEGLFRALRHGVLA